MDLNIRWAGDFVERGCVGYAAVFRCGCRFEITPDVGPAWQLCLAHTAFELTVHEAFIEQHGGCTSTVAL